MARIITNGKGLNDAFKEAVSNNVIQLRDEVIRRSSRAGTYTRNAVMEILRGPRTGKMYGTHQASAPGEPPAVQTGKLRNSFMTSNKYEAGTKKYTVTSSAKSNMAKTAGKNFNYAFIDEGTRYIKPRPYVEKAKEKALETTLKDLRRPYKNV